MGELLSVVDLGIDFGGLRALHDVTFGVKSGELYGVIGPNGAGKTTLLNCISGLQPECRGSIRFDDVQVSRRRPHQLARLGVARTFQTIENFSDFRVLDFLMLGRLHWRTQSLVRCGFALRSVGHSERAAQRDAEQLLERFDFRAYRAELLGELPYGMQKAMDVLRALASDPRLLLLDEPTSGSSESERQTLSRIIQAVGQEGTTAVIVDHDVAFISRLCHRVLAMSSGTVMAEGTPAEVMSNSAVIETYVGL